MSSSTQSPRAKVDVQSLRSEPLLADLSEDQLAAVTAAAALQHFDDGAVLMHQGDIADALYIIQMGSVEVIVRTRDGREHIIDTVGVGKPAGELGLFTGDRRSATVRARGAVVAIVVPRPAFEAAMERKGIAQKFAAELAGRLAARTRARTLEDPPLSHLLFSDTRLAPIWFVLRVWLAYQWLSAGILKLTDPVWMTTGLPLQGFWKAALVTEPRPVIAYDWYRAFIEALVVGGHYVWFAKLVACSEVAVGVALLLGAFTGLAAALGLLMNVNYLLAGSASTNPALATVAVFIVLGWKVAGWWGIDRWLLPCRTPTPLPRRRSSWWRSSARERGASIETRAPVVHAGS